MLILYNLLNRTSKKDRVSRLGHGKVLDFDNLKICAVEEFVIDVALV